jgi:peptidoglycan/LPS O-acetylase OafA/YrhL
MTSAPVAIQSVAADPVRPPDNPRVIHALAHHSPPLDGLRGLSLLAIVAVHSAHAAGFSTSSHPVDSFLHSIVAGLWISVDLFFALSGYLITSILLAAQGRPGTMFAFYARRILRIFPLFYVYLVGLHLVLPALGIPLLPRDQLHKWPWHFFFATNILTALDGVQHRVIAHFWTLAAEEQFYLVWPWIVNFLPRRVTMWVCVGALFTSTGLRAWLSMLPDVSPTVYVLPPFRWDALVLGSLAALVAYDPSVRLRSRTLWKWILVVCASLTFILKVPMANLNNWGGPAVIFGFLLISGWFAATIALCVAPRRSRLHSTPHHPGNPRHPIVHLLAWRPFCWVGKVSYAAYIFHTPVIQVLSGEDGLYRTMTPPEGRSALTAFLTCLAVTTALTLMLAAVSWHFFEGPINRLKDRFPYAKPEGHPAGDGSPPQVAESNTATVVREKSSHTTEDSPHPS